MISNEFTNELVKNLEKDQRQDEKQMAYHEEQIIWLRDRINNREITLRQLRGDK